MKRVLAAAGVVAVAVFGMGGSAQAETVAGKKPSLTVSTDVVAPTGTTKVTVKGSGFNPKKGVYVALCQDNGAGKKPGPCYGGNRGGAAQAWLSGSPVSQAMGAKKFGAKGTFKVTLTVGAVAEGLDCTKVKCVLASRADHFAPEDRSLDVLVPARIGKLTKTAISGTNAVKKGGKVTVTGRLFQTLDGTQTFWAGQKVYLEYRAKGKKWVKVGDALTKANGQVKIKATAKKGAYRLTFSGTKKAASKALSLK